MLPRPRSHRLRLRFRSSIARALAARTRAQSSSHNRSSTALRVLLLIALLGPTGLTTAASAQNLLADSEFDAGLGLTSWQTTHGSWLLGADSGSCLLSDSAAGTSADTSGIQVIGMRSQQCIPVDPLATPTLYLGAVYKTPANVYARLFLRLFSDSTCTTASGWTWFAAGAISPSWSSILGPISIPPTAASVMVYAEFMPASVAEPPFTGSFDRIYLGELPQIFVDDFETESGSACRWSSVVGGT